MIAKHAIVTGSGCDDQSDGGVRSSRAVTKILLAETGGRWKHPATLITRKCEKYSLRCLLFVFCHKLPIVIRYPRLLAKEQFRAVVKGVIFVLVRPRLQSLATRKSIRMDEARQDARALQVFGDQVSCGLASDQTSIIKLVLFCFVLFLARFYRSVEPGFLEWSKYQFNRY